MQLMHIINVHSIKTSHWQAKTEEQLIILNSRTLLSIVKVLFFC